MTAREQQRRLQQMLSRAGLLDSPESLALGRVRAGTDNGPAPLSPSQARMWYHQQLDENSTAYNICLKLHPEGTLSVGELTKALAQAVDRHAILRTTYHMGEDGEPYQVIHDEHPAQIISTELDASVEDLAAEIDVLARRVQAQPFDLAVDSPLRALLVQQAGDLVAVVLTLPHIAGDGGSLPTVLTEIEHSFRGDTAPPGTAPAIRYIDYVRWQTGHLGEPDDPGSLYSAQLDYWEGELSGLEAELPLPLDRPRGRKATFAGAQHRRWLAPELSAALVGLARRHQISPLILLQAAVSVALSQSGCGSDIPLGTPVDLRADSALSDVVGFFSNTVVLRTDLGDDPDFNELLQRAQRTMVGALEHRDIPFERVVERLNPPRSPARNPLFQVMIAATRPWPRLQLGDVGVDVVEPTHTQAKLDLTFAIHERPEGGPLGVSVLYSLDLFESDTARGLLEAVIGVLGQVAFHPRLRLSQLAHFTPCELTPRGSEIAAVVSQSVDGPTRSSTATTSRTVRLLPGTPAEPVAAAVYALLAGHDALRLTGEAGQWRIRDAAEALERPVLTDTLDDQRFSAQIQGAGGPAPTLTLTAPTTWVDEESWRALLAAFHAIREPLAAPGAEHNETGSGFDADSDAGSASAGRPNVERPAASYLDYLERTAALAEDIGLADRAEAWLDLLEAAATDPPPPAPPGRTPMARTVELPPSAGRLGTSALRDAALAALRPALRPEAAVLVGVDEPDRDGHPAVGAGRCRRIFPVLLPEYAEGERTPDGERLLAALTPIDPVHATSYQLIREVSPHTAGALDEAPEPELRLTITITDPGDEAGTPTAVKLPPEGPDLTVRWEFGGGVRRAVITVAAESEDSATELLDRWADALHACVLATPTPSTPDQPSRLVPLTAAEHRTLEGTFGPLRDVLPLSPLQEGLLFHLLSAQDKADDVYTSQTSLELTGPLDVERLHQAVAAALELCPTIGAGYADLGGRLVQVIPERIDIPWRHLDLSDAARSATDEAAQRFADEEYHADFDPARPPMARFALLSFTPDQHRLLFTAHHVLVDGWSIRLLLNLVLRLYTDPADVARPRPFRDFLAWLSEQDPDAAENAWRELLEHAQPTLLARDAPGVDATADHTGEQSRQLPAHLIEQVAVLARATGTTVSTVLELAWAGLLMRMSGSSDVVFGSVVSGRPPELDGIETMVGLLFNTVPTRVAARPGTSVRDALAGLHRQKSLQLRHSHPGLSRLQQLAGHNPLFDTLFVVQNLPRQSPDERFGPDGDLRRTGASVRDATHYPLSMAVTPESDSIALRLMYRTDAYDDTAASTLFDRYVRCLELLTTAPDLPLHRLDLLSHADRRQLLETNNATRAEISDLSVSDLLTRQAERTPQARALVAGETTLSFAELAAAAHRIGHLLLSHGVGPEHRVALLLPRAESMVEALFGVFAAHAAYVPIDGDTPTGRMRSMLEQAKPSAVLTTRSLAESLPKECAVDFQVIAVDDPDIRAELAAHPATPPLPARPYGLDHLAYIIFTSGSTGAPKGVAVPYRGLTNMFHNHQDKIFRPVLETQGGRRLRIAHTTSFSFDASWEQLLWLLAGHEVHVLDDDLRRDPDGLIDYFDRHLIDAFDVTPTYGQYLVDHGLLERPRPRGQGDGAGVVFVSLGGEAVGDALWTSLREAPGVGGYNLYGPTEYTINALGADVTDSTTPSVGRPISNTRAYILGDGLLPAPVGVVGELYLAGVGLARGYVGRTALTAERFVADPFGGPGERMYRTGDLARWRPDGGIDFLGRSDNQLKIRGYRVELSEIENALVAHPTVAQAAVVPTRGPDGRTTERLAGYVVPTVTGTPEVIDVAELREHLADLLPPYMVPATLTPVERLPLTINGKLDVAALPEPAAAAPVERNLPRTPTETAVAEVFADLLAIDTVGRDDDFFALGGHSLLVVRLVGRLREALDTPMSVRQVYDGPTPALLAALIGGDDPDEPDDTDDRAPRAEHTASVLVADAVLDESITGVGLPAAAKGWGTVLLTGASGFLGSFLIAELLKETSAQVLCLVRAENEAAAARRIRSAMESYHIWEDRFAERIIAIPGDIAKPRLGVTPQWYERICAETRTILHNGAAVNDVEPYDMVKQTNVHGAREILRIATTGTVKHVHFVSTVSVAVRAGANPPVIAEDTRLRADEVLTNGYVSSKWVAEEFMRAAAERSIPTTIHRPGRISGHSATGMCSTGNGFWYFIRAMVLLRQAPQLERDRITMAPVDYVAGAIVRLATVEDAPGSTYHLVNDQSIAIVDILDALRTEGYELPVVPFPQWRDRLDREAIEGAERGDDSLAQAVLLAEHHAKYDGDHTESRVGQDRALAHLAPSGFSCPPVTPEVLARYVRHFMAAGFFPPPPGTATAQTEGATDRIDGAATDRIDGGEGRLS
ncbi:amino acid adenylation domain-containing protein [Streptomyces sp. NPDC005953]|uniref:amino acid adenylation domain-containing protein n=1 Tax=Streptomyces sp. NPDC005953 TaxID=3156719 RepID=UPI0033E8005F